MSSCSSGWVRFWNALEIFGSLGLTGGAGALPYRCFQHPFHIFCNEIEFQVHAVARFSLMQVRHLPSVGDNPDNKTIRMQFRHGEADTVYSNGPLEDHVPRK